MSFRARSATGEGVLARYGASIVLAPADSVLVDAVIALARDASMSGDDVLLHALPRKVAGLVAQGDDTPTLGVVCSIDGALTALLVGDVTMTLTDETGTSTASGRDATTWVDKTIRSAWTSLVLALPGGGAVDERSDLSGGVVSAGGAQLSPQDAPTAAAPVAVFESFSLDPVEGEALPVAVPPQVPDEPVAGSRSTLHVRLVKPDAVATVQGIECSREHFNDPAAVYCAVCGISMVHQTHNLVEGPRPPLGVLVLDDGAVVPLVTDLVLGREPEGAAEVLAGAAAAMTLEDPELTLSRVHAKLVLVGWEVRLVDAGSANGSFSAAPGDADWTRLPTGESVVLRPGSRVAMGGRTMVFESHRKL